MAGSTEQHDSPDIDQAEFHRLFVQNQRRVFGYILTLLPRLSDAEEAFQQVCVVILGKARQFTPGTDFTRWACQIAQYEVYNYRRRRESRRMLFDVELLDRIAARRLTDGDRLENELVALRGCVAKLSESDRDLIREQYRQKITSRELASQLGRSANTVYKAIQRIRRVLRVCVERTIVRESRPVASFPDEEERS